MPLLAQPFRFWIPYSEDLKVIVRIRSSPFRKFGFAIVVTFISAGIQRLLWDYVQPFAFIFFFPGIVISALLGGFLPALLTTFSAGFIGIYYFTLTEWGAPLQRQDSIRLMSFIANGTLIAFVTSYLFAKWQSLAQMDLRETHFRMGDGFIVLSPDFKYLEVNEKAATLMELPSNHIIGKTVYELFPFIKGSLVERKFQDVLKAQKPTAFEYQNPMTKRWFEIQAYPALEGLKIYYREVTDKKVAEEQTRLRALEVQDANKKLKAVNEELRRSNQDLEQFAHVASHDMKEPLRTVSHYVQLLERKLNDQLDDEGKLYMKFAVEGAQRMHALVNDILAYSKLNNDSSQVRTAPLETCVNEAIRNLETTLKDRKGEIRVLSLPAIEVPEVGVVQVLQNILSNAIKFTDAGTKPEIEIRGSETKEQIQIEIKDNGIGIRPEHHQTVFELFRQLNSRTKYPGSGIGLALSKRIVEHLGGRIWVETSGVTGTVFSLTLPK